jgi:hypothetical protein
MPDVLSVSEARAVVGDVLGAEEVAAAFDALIDAPRIPFARTDLVHAKERGEMLVLRSSTERGGAPLTIARMIERFPDAFDARFLRKMGYQLKDDWGIELEPLTAQETCATGWALVAKTVIPDTCNLAYEEQDAIMARHAPGARRRAAVEAVYDTLLYFVARKQRLLDTTWDWTASPTVDGGYLNVGGFGAQGLQILSYSTAVRHGTLGVCPTRQPRG